MLLNYMNKLNMRSSGAHYNTRYRYTSIVIVSIHVMRGVEPGREEGTRHEERERERG